MRLRSPFLISSRLLPGLKIGNGWIQLEYSKRDGRDGRTRYQWTIDLPSGEFTGGDLQSGCQGGTLQEGFESLLSFLSAASYDDGMFPEQINEWARQNSDELSMLAIEIEESEADLIEEKAGAQ